jgi:hypothetical protein
MFECWEGIRVHSLADLSIGTDIQFSDRLCGLVVAVPGYNPEVSDTIPGATRFPDKHLVWNGVHSALVRINEELLQ